MKNKVYTAVFYNCEHPNRQTLPNSIKWYCLDCKKHFTPIKVIKFSNEIENSIKKIGDIK